MTSIALLFLAWRCSSCPSGWRPERRPSTGVAPRSGRDPVIGTTPEERLIASTLVAAVGSTPPAARADP